MNITEIDTGILFTEMIKFLLSKPRNKNDNSYNTHFILTKGETKKKEEEVESTNGLETSLKFIDLPKKGENKKHLKNKKHREKTHI